MLQQEIEPSSSLSGRIIASETQRGVTYHLDREVGSGGMGTAYLARRESVDGVSPVVVKVMRPAYGAGMAAAELVARKEAVALGRLNERVPPTPFVVRFVDTGNLRLLGEQVRPWTAVEYVHGGVEGTTLEDRVEYSIHKTGFGFDATRAAHAIRCLSEGLSAIHGVGVIHRDLSPGNVLCCGFGESEIFKIADFGVARATGLDRTFAGLDVGTIGYSAPETSDQSAGPCSDVFSLAAIVYYLLTGEHYFEAETTLAVARLLISPDRPRLTDSRALSPELAERPQACSAIDAALARATALATAERPQTAEQFAAWVLPWLGDQPSGPHSSRRLLSAVLDMRRPDRDVSYHWTVRSHPRDDIVVRSAAWDTDGRAFALSPRDARFWNGTSWVDATSVLAALPRGMTFTQRYEAGGWLVGGDSPILSVVDPQGVSDTVTAPAADVSFSLASGRMGDLMVAVGQRPEGPPTLFALAARRWMKPIPLERVGYVATLHRLDDARWLLSGRLLDGGGFAAIYSPMQWEIETLATPPLRAFIAGASASDRSVGLLVGSDGVVLRIDGSTASHSMVPHEPDLSAAAVDVLDREWATSLGGVWSRDPHRSEPWRLLWSDPAWTTPFVSLMADAGQVVAMTADGGILEGRASTIG